MLRPCSNIDDILCYVCSWSKQSSDEDIVWDENSDYESSDYEITDYDSSDYKSFDEVSNHANTKETISHEDRRKSSRIYLTSTCSRIRSKSVQRRKQKRYEYPLTKMGNSRIPRAEDHNTLIRESSNLTIEERLSNVENLLQQIIQDSSFVPNSNLTVVSSVSDRTASIRNGNLDSTSCVRSML